MKTAYKNLGEFIDVLREHDEIKFVKEPVSRILEISRITDAESKSPNGGKALFFEHVEYSEFPVATNLFGSAKRICLALGVESLDEIGRGIRALIETKPPRGVRDMLGLLPTVLSVSKFFPKMTKAGTPACQEVVYKGEDVNLMNIPVLKCWPKDAGPFVTLPLVFTKSLASGRRNLGMYRLQIFDEKTTGMHWHIHKDGSHYFQEYRKAGEKMPVAVAIGADPATIYSATAPMPRNLDELILAGFIRNKPVRMCKCLTIDMEVPAEAEFVLEGYVDPDELRLEGPFGDHTGYYSLADHYPVFHVTALTHRKKPVYCATLVGPPPMEDCYLAKATERIFLPLLQTAFPEVTDYWMPWEGVFHNLVVASIHKEYPGHAQKVMHGLWGQGQMSFCKCIVVMDDDVDLSRPGDVFTTILERLDLTSDVTYTKGVLDVLDHSSPTPVFGSKIGLDLTAKKQGEPERISRSRMLPDNLKKPEILKSVVQTSAEGIKDAGFLASFSGRNLVLLVSVDKGDKKSGKYFADRLLGDQLLSEFNIIVMFDEDVELTDHSRMLWKLTNNVDPGRHFYLRHDRVVIDACKKGSADGHDREWPEELSFDLGEEETPAHE